jgi:hypothetical protein
MSSDPPIFPVCIAGTSPSSSVAITQTPALIPLRRFNSIAISRCERSSSSRSSSRRRRRKSAAIRCMSVRKNSRIS